LTAEGRPFFSPIQTEAGPPPQPKGVPLIYQNNEDKRRGKGGGDGIFWGDGKSAIEGKQKLTGGPVGKK